MQLLQVNARLPPVEGDLGTGCFQTDLRMATWILKSEDRNRLVAFYREAWCYLLAITWPDQVSNDQLSTWIGNRSCFFSAAAMQCKVTWIDHATQQGGMLDDTLLGSSGPVRRSRARSWAASQRLSMRCNNWETDVLQARRTLGGRGLGGGGLQASWYTIYISLYK